MSLERPRSKTQSIPSMAVNNKPAHISTLTPKGCNLQRKLISQVFKHTVHSHPNGQQTQAQRHRLAQAHPVCQNQEDQLQLPKANSAQKLATYYNNSNNHYNNNNNYNNSKSKPNIKKKKYIKVVSSQIDLNRSIELSKQRQNQVQCSHLETRSKDKSKSKSKSRDKHKLQISINLKPQILAVQNQQPVQTQKQNKFEELQQPKQQQIVQPASIDVFKTLRKYLQSKIRPMQSASMPILDISSHSLGLDNIPMKTTNDGDCNTGNYKRSGPTDTPIDELYMFDEIMDEKNQKDLEQGQRGNDMQKQRGKSRVQCQASKQQQEEQSSFNIKLHSCSRDYGIEVDVDDKASNSKENNTKCTTKVNTCTNADAHQKNHHQWQNIATQAGVNNKMDFNEKYMHKYTYSYIEPNSVNLFAHMQAHKNSQNLSLNNIRHPHHTNVRISYINSNSLEKKEIYHPNNTNPNHHNIYANVNIQGLTKNVFTHNINLSLNDKRMNSVGDGVNENQNQKPTERKTRKGRTKIFTVKKIDDINKSQQKLVTERMSPNSHNVYMNTEISYNEHRDSINKYSNQHSHSRNRNNRSIQHISNIPYKWPPVHELSIGNDSAGYMDTYTPTSRICNQHVGEVEQNKERVRIDNIDRNRSRNAGKIHVISYQNLQSKGIKNISVNRCIQQKNYNSIYISS